MSDERPHAETGRRDQPAFATCVGDDAHVEKLVNVRDARDIYLGGRAAPQALFQLPSDIPDFVGRDGLLADLGTHLQGAPAQGMSAGARAVLYGPPGVGKSALAIRLAHTIKQAWPDTQLYVNLGAGTGMPLTPAEALAGFLRALGVEGPYPESEDERAAFYRSQLEGKRALVVLDNARNLAQIRPLLPGSPMCAAIVTARRPLGGLEGAFSHKVDTLKPDVAVELLGEIVGSLRTEAEPEAALKIACLCGELPLAVRIAGGRLKNSPHRTLTWLADQLEDERNRLGELALEDQAVRVSFAVSYEDLAPAEARLFCVLAALPGPDFSTALATGAGQADVRETERLLDRLVEAQVLEAIGVNRYRFHDLIRLFADERLDAEPGLDRQEITNRATVWLNERAQDANRALGAGDSRHADALAWLEAERKSLVAAIEANHAAHNRSTVLDLTLTLAPFFSLRSHWDDWTRTNALALQSAREAGDRSSEARILQNLANAYDDLGRWKEAIDNCEQALAIYHEVGDRLGEGYTLNILAVVYNNLRRWTKAIDNCEQALAICREVGDRSSEGQTLTNLANAYSNLGRWDEAIANYKRALAICREVGDRRGEGLNLNNLAIVYSNLGRWDEAIANYKQDLAICRELGDRHGEGLTLSNIGLTEQRSGDVASAERHMREAIKLLDALGAPEANRVRALLAEIENPPAS